MSNSKFLESIGDYVAKGGYTYIAESAGDDDFFTVYISAKRNEQSTYDNLQDQISKLTEENKMLKTRLARVETT